MYACESISFQFTWKKRWYSPLNFLEIQLKSFRCSIWHIFHNIRTHFLLILYLYFNDNFKDEFDWVVGWNGMWIVAAGYPIGLKSPSLFWAQTFQIYMKIELKPVSIERMHYSTDLSTSSTSLELCKTEPIIKLSFSIEIHTGVA